MKVERVRGPVLTVTAHAYELAALVSGARWALDHGHGQLPREAEEQLADVLAAYDAELGRLRGAGVSGEE